MSRSMNSNSLPPQISHSNSQVNSSEVATLRLYQVWKGRNRFCFGGRLIFGPDVKSLFLTVFLIVTPTTLFCTFVPRSLIDNFPHHLGILVVAICAAFTVYVISILLLTSSRDPGIIPRNPYPPEDESDSSLSANWAGSQNCVPSLPHTKDVVVNGMVVKVKYCQTCMLYRPPRCSHCSICNNCVERFDHHCPWVGQCIGKRNYRLFFMFVSSTTMLCLYVFSFCRVSIRTIMEDHHCNLWTAFLRSPVSGFLVVYTFIAAWFVGGLTTFHLYLILTNQTTYENFRYQYDRKMNPYNLGCARNFWDIFCADIPVSRNNFRAKVIAYTSSALSPSVVSLGGATMSSDDTSSDVEMGKRHEVAAEDIKGMHCHMESIRGLERCGTQPRQTYGKDYKQDWETSPDFRVLPDDSAKECDQMERNVIHGSDSHISS